MNRLTFIKSSALLGAGSIVKPSSIVAEEQSFEWLFDILAELAKTILIDLIEKPIEKAIRDILDIPDSQVEKDAKDMNNYYQQRGMYSQDKLYSNVRDFAFFPAKTATDAYQQGRYEVPFYNYNSDGTIKNKSIFLKHEIEAIKGGSEHLANLNSAREINTALFLPSHEIHRANDNLISYQNREGGEVNLHRIASNLSNIYVQSDSFSPKSRTKLTTYTLKT
jgi:hypothetical protein